MTQPICTAKNFTSPNSLSVRDQASIIKNQYVRKSVKTAFVFKKNFGNWFKAGRVLNKKIDISVKTAPVLNENFRH